MVVIVCLYIYWKKEVLGRHNTLFEALCTWAPTVTSMFLCSNFQLVKCLSLEETSSPATPGQCNQWLLRRKITPLLTCCSLSISTSTLKVCVNNKRCLLLNKTRIPLLHYIYFNISFIPQLEP